MTVRQRVLPKIVELLPGLRSSFVATRMIGLMLALGVMSPPALAQEPVPCDRLETSLSPEFANSICYRSRFTGSDARGWHEQIQAENTRHLITVVRAKATDNRSYLHGTSIDQLFRRFSLPPEMKMLSDPATTEQGFQFATVGAPASTYCILFLREDRPRRGGYQILQYGLACDKARDSAYSVGDVEALLSKINFAE